MQALATIRASRLQKQWDEVVLAADEEFQKLLGAGAEAVRQLSDAEIVARLVKRGSTHMAQHKLRMVVALLKEAGDAAAGQERIDEARAFYLKALHLLLDSPLAEDASDAPDYVPKVEVLAEGLRGTEIPAATHVILMRHYESSGQFSKAEDEFFAILDADGASAATIEFGLSFYGRLQSQSDAALATGNLPRVEVEASLLELANRRRGCPQSIR